MKKWIGLLMAVVLCFSCVSVLADDTPQYTPTLTNALFKNDSCSDILSSSYNRALISVLLFMDLSSEDVLSSDQFATLILNSWVGKPSDDTLRNAAISLVMYDDSYIYVITYVPLLQKCSFLKTDRGGLTASLIDSLIGQFVEDRKANSMDDIVSVLNTIQEALDK